MPRPVRPFFLLAACLAASAQADKAQADEADVTAADIRLQADGRFSISATVRHEDEGWQHYADRWEVLGPDGAVIATRVLAHPHVSEQPFTRRLRGIDIPAGVRAVTLRARDNRHGYGGKAATLAVPGRGHRPDDERQR